MLAGGFLVLRFRLGLGLAREEGHFDELLCEETGEVMMMRQLDLVLRGTVCTVQYCGVKV